MAPPWQPPPHAEWASGQELNEGVDTCAIDGGAEDVWQGDIWQTSYALRNEEEREREICTGTRRWPHMRRQNPARCAPPGWQSSRPAPATYSADAEIGRRLTRKHRYRARTTCTLGCTSRNLCGKNAAPQSMAAAQALSQETRHTHPGSWVCIILDMRHTLDGLQVTRQSRAFVAILHNIK